MQFIVVGQWQGSASSRAMRLADGAAAIGADLPRSATASIPVPPGAGDRLTSAILRYTAIRTVSESVSVECRVATEPVLLIGGDGAAVLGASTLRLPDTAFVRIAGSSAYRPIDPTQPTAAETVALRVLLSPPGEPFPDVQRFDPARTVVAGVRGIDNAERTALTSTGVTVLDADDTTADTVRNALERSDSRSVFVHVDLDVLDPSVIDGLLEPVPFGLEVSTLVELIHAATDGRRLVGAALSGFAPISPERAGDDLGAILRIIAALSAATHTP